jgi:hypothetical protein
MSAMKCLKCHQELNTNVARYGLHPDCFSAWFKVQPDTQFVSLTRKSSHSNKPTKETQKHTSFFQGKFKKYSAELDSESYILKMKEKEAPELPDVEYLCNQIGRLIGIPVAEFYIVNFEEERVFVTKNFIKKGALSDLQHIYHFVPEGRYKCEELIKAIVQHTKRAYDVGVFIDTLLFDSLIGNIDRHGRNLAFIVSSGKCVLSPIYDNVASLALESTTTLNFDFNPLGAIATSAERNPGMKEYVEEFIRLGHEDHVKKFSSKIQLEPIKMTIEQSFCSRQMKDAMARLISKRAKELEDEINRR